MIVAAPLSPSASAGKAMCLSPSMGFSQTSSDPNTGRMPRVTPNSKMSMSANQKSGIAIPNIAPLVATISVIELRFRAATTPVTSPNTSETINPAAASCIVCGSREPSSVVTGRLFWKDLPQLPVTMPPSQLRYWMGSGRSSPSCRIMASRISGVSASLSSPAIE